MRMRLLTCVSTHIGNPAAGASVEDQCASVSATRYERGHETFLCV